ncbi:MAG: DJ-1/PfpI family protein, partial [Fusobacterium sp.]|nr:DJ-1/PfpI family protein [Fusobacterium sp.]
KNINFDDGDLIILPGGYPGYINLRENKEVVEIVKNYLEKDKYVAAICGAPTIFSYNNLALGRKITGHSSTKNELSENHIYTDEPIFADKNIITGIGAGHSLDFAFLIAEQFFSKEKILEVKKGMELI